MKHSSLAKDLPGLLFQEGKARKIYGNQKEKIGKHRNFQKGKIRKCRGSDKGRIRKYRGYGRAKIRIISDI